jgi:hypothetical protein
MHAQDEEPLDREPVTCINRSRLATTSIVDEQTVLFYFRGGRVLRNTLQHRCPNLDRTDTLAYGVTASRLASLCAGDLINTEDGVSCRIGPFVPMTAAEAKALLARDDEDSGVTTSSEAAAAPADDAEHKKPANDEPQD